VGTRRGAGGRRRASGAAVVLALAGGLVGAACAPAGGASRAGDAPAAPATASATGRAVPSAGCAAPAPAPLDDARQTMTVDGAARWYLLTTPPAGVGPRARPVVLDLHGLGEGAQIHATTTQFGAKAAATGFIAAFPEGTGTPVGWDLDNKAARNPDIDFLSALLRRLESTMCVDTSRLYVTGLSDGALMTSVLACTMAGTFAAFAPVSGISMPTPCHPGRRVPILTFHGTADPILYFNGGVGTGVLDHALGGGPAPPSTTLPPARLNGPGIPAAVRAWAALDGCHPAGRDARPHPHIVLRTYRCPTGAAVEFYIVVGGGHAWPGSRFSAAIASITGPTTFEVRATDVIWQFFRRYQLPRPRAAHPG